jgi:hypothetical protein
MRRVELKGVGKKKRTIKKAAKPPNMHSSAHWILKICT